MANELIYILISVIGVSLASLIGLFTLSINRKFFDKILMGVIAFAAGAMLGVAFFDLIPEAIELQENAIALVLVGILLFYFIERFIHWRHCHRGVCEIHPAGALNLIGDGVHNFIDGAVIAAAYLTNIQLGLVSTVAILLHEIPQEIGDFGILINSGFTRAKALTYNFIVALSAVAGAVIMFVASSAVQAITPFMLAIAAGGFIYIAVADLFPEINEVNRLRELATYSLLMLIGIGIMYSLSVMLGV